MPGKFQNKAELKEDIKALTRPRRNRSEPSSENGERSQAKPPSKSSKPFIEKLDRATNSQGEVFKADDLIRVQDLKASPTTAKIKYFYAEQRGAMAVYEPAEEQETGWLWERGCCLVDTLIKA